LVFLDCRVAVGSVLGLVELVVEELRFHWDVGHTILKLVVRQELVVALFILEELDSNTKDRGDLLHRNLLTSFLADRGGGSPLIKRLLYNY
jgi:hypothetical protein